MASFIKKPIFLISGAVIIAIIIAGYAYLGKETKPTYDYIIAKKMNLVQEVSATGRVKPMENIDLAFEKSGKISSVDVKVGDKIAASQKLAAIDDAEIKAQLAGSRAQLETAKAQLGQYEAALEREEAKLTELKKGTRPEEIKIAETAVENAQKALNDAQINYENVKTKAESDLGQLYDGAINTAAKTVTVAANSLFILTDIQFAHFNNYTQTGIKIADTKAEAVYALLGAQNTGYWSREAVGQLNGGAKATVQNAQISPTNKNIDNALSGIKNALDKIKEALEAVPIASELTATEVTSLNTEKNNINTETITITSKQKAIEVQKTTNDNSISSAQMKVNDAASVLLSAKDTLDLKKAGSAPEQIAAQEAQIKQSKANITSQKAQIKQAEANVYNYEIQISKTILRSPIKGIVTKQDAKIGEIISANSPIVSIMSENKFQIEANIPEVDITKVKISDAARITLDAYGNDVNFEAKVISIDPAENIIEGVPTYKTTLLFTEEDGRLKSGMTANIDIMTQSRENVIAIPQRAVTISGESKTVKILVGENAAKEVEIKTGIRDSEGNVEIIEGINEGDKVVTFIKE